MDVSRVGLQCGGLRAAGWDRCRGMGESMGVQGLSGRARNRMKRAWLALSEPQGVGAIQAGAREPGQETQQEGWEGIGLSGCLASRVQNS